MDNDWTKVLGFPGYRVYKHEIDERRKHVTLWIRRKRGNQVLRCPVCGRRAQEIHEVIERTVRDLPCFEYTTTVIVELYRLRCPDCGLKTERMPQLPSKAPYTKRFASCGRRGQEIHEVIERAARDLPCFECPATVIVELYRLRCPDCGLKTERMPQLPSKAPY